MKLGLLLTVTHTSGLKLTCLTFPTPVIVQCLRSDSSCFGHYNRSCLLACLHPMYTTNITVGLLLYICDVSEGERNVADRRVL